MGHGHWFGDEYGSDIFWGEITNVTLDGSGKLIFDYNYTRGGHCDDGHFEGHVDASGVLAGNWTETFDGVKRIGTGKEMEGIKRPGFGHAFKGRYLLTSHAVLKKHDKGDWTIEFDL